MTVTAAEARNLLRQTLEDLQTHETVIAHFRCAYPCDDLHEMPTDQLVDQWVETPKPSKSKNPHFRKTAWCIDFIVTLVNQQHLVIEYDALTAFVPRKIGNRWTDPVLETLKCEMRADWFRVHKIPMLRIGYCIDPDEYRSVIMDFCQQVQQRIRPPNSQFWLKTIGHCYASLPSSATPNSIVAQIHIARELCRLRRAGHIDEVFRQHPVSEKGLVLKQHPFIPFRKYFDFAITTKPARVGMIDWVSPTGTVDDFKEFWCRKYNIPLLVLQNDAHLEKHLKQLHRFIRALQESPEFFLAQ